MDLKRVTGIALLIFLFVFGTLILFGKIGNFGWGGLAKFWFILSYFILTGGVLTLFYLLERKLFSGRREHIFVMILFFILAISLTSSMLKAKEVYVQDQLVLNQKLILEQQIQTLSESNQQNRDVLQTVSERIKQLQATNQQLQLEFKQIQDGSYIPPTSVITANVVAESPSFFEDWEENSKDDDEEEWEDD